VTTQTNVYFCTECGSPAVERSLLSGGDGSCRGCGWAGPAERLAVMPIAHKFGNETELLVALVNDLRQVMMKDVGIVLLRYLQKWGFVDMQQDKVVIAKQLGRYVAAAARGIVTAIFEERDKMEVERGRSS